jgi:pyruvate/2-oxoglutarate dehydrogenase complex dihydrolipoamide acyltransferase (E2) component
MEPDDDNNEKLPGVVLAGPSDEEKGSDGRHHLRDTNKNDGHDNSEHDGNNESADEERCKKEMSSSSESSDVDGKPAGLSDYELLRLARIRRNSEYLSQLGLSGNDSVLSKTKLKRNRKPASLNELQEKRSSSRARKSVSYTEPSVADLLRQSLVKSSSSLSVPKDGEEDDIMLTKQSRVPNGEGKRNPNKRRERFIFNEFRAIEASKKRSLREAEKAVRAAVKEVAYWKKRAVFWARQEERRRETERIKKVWAEEMANLGGTIKQLLHEVDERMPELLAAASKYDEVFEVRDVVVGFAKLLVVACLTLTLTLRSRPHLVLEQDRLCF